MNAERAAELRGERPGEEVLIPCQRCTSVETADPECPMCGGFMGVLPSRAPWPVDGVEEFFMLRGTLAKFGLEGFRVVAGADPSAAMLQAVAMFDGEVERTLAEWSAREQKRHRRQK